MLTPLVTARVKQAPHITGFAINVCKVNTQCHTLKRQAILTLEPSARANLSAESRTDISHQRRFWSRALSTPLPSPSSRGAPGTHSVPSLFLPEDSVSLSDSFQAMLEPGAWIARRA